MAHCRIKPGVICLAFFQPPTPGERRPFDDLCWPSIRQRCARARALPRLLRAFSLAAVFQPCGPIDRSASSRQQTKIENRPVYRPRVFHEPGRLCQNRLYYNQANAVTEDIAYKFTTNRSEDARLSFPGSKSSGK